MKWEKPSPSWSRGRGQAGRSCVEEAAALRANPKRWGILREGPKTDYVKLVKFASNVRQGGLASFKPPKAFESAVRTEGDTVKVYARYVGEET